MKKPLIDCHTHIGIDPIFYVEGSFPYAQQFRNLVEEAHGHGIERLITFPFINYLGWEGLNVTWQGRKSGDFAVPYAFENVRMLSEIYELNADIASAAIPFVILDPARHQQAQVDSLRKLREKFPIRGFKIQPTIIRAPIRELLGNGRCILELAAEWDLPVLIHSSISSADIWSQAWDILDVAEAWPGVRFCLAHSCRFDLPSLERLGTMENTWFDCSAHCIHCDSVIDGLPNVAIPERLVPADYSRPDAVMKTLAELLPGRMMWGSDAPFYSYAAKHDKNPLCLISSYAREVAALGLLSDEQKTALLHDNIVRFLGRSGD